MRVPVEIKAIGYLKAYNGENDYILYLKNKYLKNNRFNITKSQAKYVVDNIATKPLIYNKQVSIHKSCQQYLQKQLGLPFIPESIFINKLLSRDNDLLHVWGCFNENCNDYELIYISKNCIKIDKKIKKIDFDKYERKPKEHQITAINALLANDKFILADQMGLGKMEHVDNRVFTPYGRKRIGDVVVGDKIIGSNGMPYNVTGVFPQGNMPLYRVTFNDGYSILVGGEHLWTVSSSNYGENNKNSSTNRYITLTTNQMLNKELILEQEGCGRNKKKLYKFSTYYKKKNGVSKWQIPIVKPIEYYNNYSLPIEPYLMGVILGDGHNRKTSIGFTFHKDDFDEILSGVKVNEVKSLRPNVRICNLYLKNELMDLGLNEKKSYEKFIPDVYKYATIKDRIAILQGLMDTDGHVTKSKSGKKLFSGTEFSTTSERLADDVAEIVHSLGGIVRKKKKVGSYTKNGVKHICRLSYRLSIKMPNDINPFRLKRKANLYNTPEKYKVGRYINNIELCESGDAVCISVDSPDKLYVTEHAIVTHNTTSAIIAAIEGDFKKILVICPASLKLNWKKEISYYDNPDSISIVDGSGFKAKKWTIINYDILKNYHYAPQKGVKIEDLAPSAIDFHKFDLVIADEAHYLKSATSSRSKIFNDFSSRIPNRWLLTGTPITNRPIDFYNLLHICDSPLASNWVHYAKRYCNAKQFSRKTTSEKSKKKYWVTSGASNLDELREYTSDIMLRRTKKESINLPQKTVKPIYLSKDSCLNYNAYLQEYLDWVDNTDHEENKPKLSDHLTKLIKVRQVLSFDKMQHTIDLVEDFIDNDQKVVIFSCFTQTINEIHEHFGSKSVLIDGSVSKERRQLAVDRFQSDDKVKVFCGNIIAAGVGLTLTEGTVVIFNDLDWVPANHAQAEDRIHRIGQTNDVHIIYLLFDDTLDTLMFDSLQAKIKVINKVMGDSDDEHNSVTSEVINKIKNKK